MADEVLTEVDGRVLVITLNRPGVRNAIDTAVTEGLITAIARLEDEPQLTVGVIAGAGGSFCAGLDLKAFARQGAPRGLHGMLRRGCSKPLLAAIEGHCLAGGLELALVCDLLVGARSSTYGLPEVGRGLFAGAGGLIRLPRRIPFAAAMEMAITGDPIDASAAHELGLLSRVVADGEALEAAMRLARRVSENAPLAVAASKVLVRQALDGSEEEFWAVQKPLMQHVFSSDDAKEGPRAFAEQRDPDWSGT
jgi:enoyl-CoA hydratase